MEDFIRSHPAGRALRQAFGVSAQSNAQGRALDLGCGSGTSSLALARAGWSVTGVDFAPRAIKKAKQKTKNENLSVNFLVADATNLPRSLFTIPYDLVLDIGCFHGLSTAGKSAYLDQLNRLLAPGGDWLLYGFFKPEESPGSSAVHRAGPGLIQADLDQAGQRLRLVKRQDGVDKRDRPSAWLWFQKTAILAKAAGDVAARNPKHTEFTGNNLFSPGSPR